MVDSIVLSALIILFLVAELICMISLDLKRIKYGSIDIGELPSRTWRYLRKEELNYCKDIISNWDAVGAGWNKI